MQQTFQPELLDKVKIHSYKALQPELRSTKLFSRMYRLHISKNNSFRLSYLLKIQEIILYISSWSNSEKFQVLVKQTNQNFKLPIERM